MLMRISTVSSFLIAATCFAAMPNPSQANQGTEGWRGARYAKKVTGTDDWLPGPLTGQMFCSRGELDLTDPAMPACLPDTILKIRGASARALMYGDDPRLVGELSFTVNGNLDATSYTGPVWGTWTLDVDTCDGSWEGTWYGRRTFVPNQPGPLGPGAWIGVLELRGHGSGGCVDQLRIKATEIITTLTPLPVAYELIPGVCNYGCLPEGVIHGTIFESRWWRRADENLSPSALD